MYAQDWLVRSPPMSRWLAVDKKHPIQSSTPSHFPHSKRKSPRQVLKMWQVSDQRERCLCPPLHLCPLRKNLTRHYMTVLQNVITRKVFAISGSTNKNMDNFGELFPTQGGVSANPKTFLFYECTAQLGKRPHVGFFFFRNLSCFQFPCNPHI